MVFELVPSSKKAKSGDLYTVYNNKVVFQNFIDLSVELRSYYLKTITILSAKEMKKKVIYIIVNEGKKKDAKEP